MDRPRFDTTAQATRAKDSAIRLVCAAAIALGIVAGGVAGGLAQAAPLNDPAQHRLVPGSGRPGRKLRPSTDPVAAGDEIGPTSQFRGRIGVTATIS